MTKTPIAVAVVATTIFALAGCAGRGSTPGVNPTPNAYTATIAGNYGLCDTLLPAGTAATLQGLNAPNMGDSFEQDTLAYEPEAVDDGGFPLARMVHRDGVLCAWGDADSLDGPTLIVGYGRISSADASSEKAALVTAGSEQISAERYGDEDGYPGQYVFGNGYWLYVGANNNVASTLFGTSLDASGFADSVIAQAPAF
jgi:hypothetical protein